MRNNNPRAWDDAVEVGQAIHTGLHGIRGEVFLHRVTVVGAPMHALRSQNRTTLGSFATVAKNLKPSSASVSAG